MINRIPNYMNRFLLVLISFIALFEVSLSQEDFKNRLIHPINLNFEQGKPGQVAVGWKVTKSAAEFGYESKISIDNPIEGRNCLELGYDGEVKEGIFGSVMQTVDAKPYRGKRIKYRAAIKAQITSDTGRVHLWLRERLLNKQEGYMNTLDDNPHFADEWEYYEIIADISEYATVVNFGVLIYGTGYAWIDDASIEILYDKSSNAPAKELNKQELENIASFTKSFGYFTFFHPSNESKYLNINKELMAGIEYIQNAKDNKELKEKLNKFYKPLSDVFEFTDKKQKSSINKKKPKTAVEGVAAAWIHQFANEGEKKASGSTFTNALGTQRRNNAFAMQYVEVDRLKGKEIELSLWAKCKFPDKRSKAFIWVKVENKAKKALQSFKFDDKLINSKKWKEYKVKLKLDKNAYLLRYTIVMIGDGKLYLDDISLNLPGKKENLLSNSSFENDNPNTSPKRWLLHHSSKAEGYKFTVSKKEKHSGNHSLLIYSDMDSYLKTPAEFELYTANINKDIDLHFPLTLYTDSLRTLPYPDNKLKKIQSGKSDDFVQNYNDLYSRLAIVSKMWIYLNQFSLSDTKVDESKILKEALFEAGKAKDRNELLYALKKMLASFSDSQARVWHREEEFKYTVPLKLNVMNNKIYVEKVYDQSLGIKAASEVISINGKSVKEYLNSVSPYINEKHNIRKMQAAINMLEYGEKDEEIKLKLADGKEYNIKRNFFISDVPNTQLNAIEAVNKNTYYVDAAIGEAKVNTYLEELAKAKNIILDFRGFTDLSDNIVSLYSKKSGDGVKKAIPLFTFPDQKYINYRYAMGRVVDGDIKLPSKLYILADYRTLGQAENLLALFKHYKLATIIGSESAGAYQDIAPFDLGAGFFFSMTVNKVFGADGKELTKPIKPDVKAGITIESMEKGYDPALEAALQIIAKENGE